MKGKNDFQHQKRTRTERSIQLEAEATRNNAELEQVVAVSNAEKAEPEKKPKKKWLWTLLFVVVNVAAISLTAVMDFGSEHQSVPLSEVLGVTNQNMVWGFIAIGLFVLSFMCEVFRRYVLLRVTVKKRLFRTSLFSTGLCKYYDSITPLGSGGQPFEIWYMRSRGVPGAISSGITIVCYALGQLAFVFIAILIIAMKGFLGVGTAIIVLAIVGIVVNICLPLGIIVFSIMPKFGEAVANFITALLFKLRIVKDKEKFRNKATASLKEYARCIKYFFLKYTFVTVINFLLEVAARLALYSIPYCVMRLCGATNVDYWTLLDLCLICYCAVAIVPTPGSSGAAELSFYSIFSSILAGGFLFWGMIFWRFSSYYLFIVFGVGFIIADKVSAARRERREKRNKELGIVEEEPYQQINEEASKELFGAEAEKAVSEDSDYSQAEVDYVGGEKAKSTDEKIDGETEE